MLNSIWPLFIICSIIYGIMSGNLEQLNNSVFNGAQDAVTTTLTLLGSMCLWNGLMNIAEKTKFVDVISKIISPLVRILFPEIKENKKITHEVSMNMVANILGLGNAATPLGLKAINSMQKENKNKKELSNSMLTLIVINTASIQLIPTTVIAIRSSLGSSNPTNIIVPVWIATIIAAIVGIISSRIVIKLTDKKR